MLAAPRCPPRSSLQAASTRAQRGKSERVRPTSHCDVRGVAARRRRVRGYVQWSRTRVVRYSGTAKRVRLHLGPNSIQPLGEARHRGQRPLASRRARVPTYHTWQSINHWEATPSPSHSETAVLAVTPRLHSRHPHRLAPPLGPGVSSELALGQHSRVKGPHSEVHEIKPPAWGRRGCWSTKADGAIPSASGSWSPSQKNCQPR